MKLRPGPLIALILLVVLGGWVYLTEFRGAGERRRAEEARQRPIPFQRDEVSALRIENEHGVFRVRRADDGWELTEPLQTRADKEAVNGLLSALEFAKIERRIGAEADLTRYALDPPTASLTLEMDSNGDARTLALGEKSPIGATWFALLPGGEEVALVSASLGDIAAKTLLMLRDKSLIDLDPWKVERLRIERGSETVVLEKPDDGWTLRRPVEAPADGPTVTDLLTELQRLRARSFVQERVEDADLARYGLDPPAARMAIFQAGWDAEKSVLFGSETEGARYARNADREPVITIPADFWPKVQTGIFDLRRKDLLVANQYRITSITAARAGMEDLVLEKQDGDDWAVSGPVSGTAGESTVNVLLNNLSDLEATGFIDRPDQATLTALTNRPLLALTLVEEPDAEGAEPRTQRLLIGPPGANGQARVRDAAWSWIALAPGAVVERILKKLDDIAGEAAAPPPGESAAASDEPATGGEETSPE